MRRRLEGRRETVNLEPISFDVAWRAVAKGNKQKVARHGARRSIVRDFDGSLRRDEEEFCERALGRIEEAVAQTFPWSCPIRVVVTFLFSNMPKNWPAWKRETALIEGEEGRWHYDQKPDLENVEKWLFDSLEKAFYKDDKAIWKKDVEKRYWTEDRVRVTLYPTPQPSNPGRKKKK